MCKIEQQDELIKSLNERIRNLENQKENEKKKLMQKEIQDIERYNKLYKRYSDLLNKYNMIENEETQYIPIKQYDNEEVISLKNIINDLYEKVISLQSLLEQNKINQQNIKNKNRK